MNPKVKTKFLVFILFLFQSFSFAQSTIETILKSGEIIVTGLSFIKGEKSQLNSKSIESVCVKNKLSDKITFRIVGKDEQGNEVKKELVIQKDGKECLLELLKGIYSYEVELANKEIYKKGEYKFTENTIITVKID